MEYYIIHLISLMLIMTALLAGQQLLLFNCGLLCLGTAAFFSLGAYVSAVLSVQCGVSPFLSILVASLTGLISAGLIGFPLLRFLKGDYFALATLALAQANFVFLRSLGPGGSAGMAGIPELHSPLSILLPPSVDTLVLHLLFLCFSFTLIWLIRNRRFGKIVDAVRLDENSLSLLGYSPTFVKVQVFALACFLAAASGAFHAHYIGAIEPGLSSIKETVLLLCGTILAGKKHLWGSFIGAFFLIVLPDLLQGIFTTGMGAKWQVFPIVQILYGALIAILALIWFRKTDNILKDQFN